MDFAKQLRKHCKGRLAVHAHLSRLAPENRNSHIIREAAACFHSFIKGDKGQLFRLSNGDLVFISKGLSTIDVESAIIAVRALVRHDPILESDDLSDPRHDTLVDWYELATDYDAFLSHVRNIQNAHLQGSLKSGSSENIDFAKVPSVTPERGGMDSTVRLKSSQKLQYRPIEAPPKPDPKAYTPPEKAMTPSDLDRLESNLRNSDPSSFIDPRMVAAVVGENAPPHPVFSEHHISYLHLQNTVLPNCDIKANPWLFAHLTRLLECQLLKTLKFGDTTGALAVSFPSHVDAVLSDAFTRFDRERKKQNDRPVIVEIRFLDALNSVKRYNEARDLLRRMGYRICLYAMDAYDFTALNRDQVIADFEKVHWYPDYEQDLVGKSRERFVNAIAKTGRGRLILDHCDGRNAITFGRSLGFTLFQGRYIDDLLNDSPPQRQVG